MKPVQTVGILGLGKMGCPIAAHLVAKSFKVVGLKIRMGLGMPKAPERL